MRAQKTRFPLHRLQFRLGGGSTPRFRVNVILRRRLDIGMEKKLRGKSRVPRGRYSFMFKRAKFTQFGITRMKKVAILVGVRLVFTRSNILPYNCVIMSGIRIQTQPGRCRAGRVKCNALYHGNNKQNVHFLKVNNFVCRFMGFHILANMWTEEKIAAE